MAGATIAAAASLTGAILIIFFVARGRPYSEFSIDALGDVTIINAFPAGILLGLVFLHILPESVALAGKFDWRISTLIISGFLLGLATEHILNVMGLHHAHAGHSTTSAATVQPDVDVPSAMEQGGIEMVVASPQDAGAATSAIPVALPADEKAAAQAEHMVLHAHHSPIVVNILVGDFFHNLFDGIAIGSAFLSCGGLGWVVTASVVVHELPQVTGQPYK
jgi:zinc transporter ZupT